MGEENEPPNEPDVILFGTLLFLVRSRSRDGMRHLVDLEPTKYWQGNQQVTEPSMCSCEDYLYNKARPCWHVTRAAQWLLNEAGIQMGEYLAENNA